jgi:hypothetical protein
MNATQVLNLTDEYEQQTGESSEDWAALLAWIEQTKGADVRKAFEARCKRPL